VKKVHVLTHISFVQIPMYSKIETTIQQDTLEILHNIVCNKHKQTKSYIVRIGLMTYFNNPIPLPFYHPNK